MKSNIANTNIDTEKSFVADLFIESSLTILGFLLLLLLI